MIGQVKMECNSENTSYANSVHLEGNFLFLFSFFVTRNKKLLTNAELLFSISGKGCIAISFYMFFQLFYKCFNIRFLFCNW